MNWWMLNRRVHVSWVIAAIALGVVVGVMMSPYLPFSTTAVISWLLVGIILTVVSLASRKTWLIIFALLAGFSLGMWRGSVTLVDMEPYRVITESVVDLKGVVAEDPDLDERGRSVLRVKQVTINNHALPGRVWVVLGTKYSIQRSDIIHVSGKASEGFGAFKLAMYDPKIMRVDRPIPGDIALTMRNEFAEQVRSEISEPQASLGLGYLLGQRRSLPPDLDQALQIAGLTHVIVASGYNLTILVRFARRFFVKVSRYLAMLSGGVMVVGFIAVTGMSPSMSRAGLVTALSLLAWYYGRKFHPFVLLSLVAALTLLINPSYGWGDLGWQLSFAAFAGVMVMAPLLQAYFFGNKKPGTLRQIIGETFSAQLATLPLLLVVFGQLSNVALIANILILPFVPLAMILVFMTGFMNIVMIPVLPELFGSLASGLLIYMTTLASWLADQSWAQSEISISFMTMWLIYACFIATLVYIWRKTKLNLRNANLVE